MFKGSKENAACLIKITSVVTPSVEPNNLVYFNHMQDAAYTFGDMTFYLQMWGILQNYQIVLVIILSTFLLVVGKITHFSKYSLFITYSHSLWSDQSSAQKFSLMHNNYIIYPIFTYQLDMNFVESSK